MQKNNNNTSHEQNKIENKTKQNE